MREVGACCSTRLLTIMRLLLAAGLVSSLGVLIGGDGLTLLSMLWCLVTWSLLVALWFLLARFSQQTEAACVSEEPALTPQQQEGEFLSGMGHDLRQPAQAIALFAATLSAHPLPDSSRKLVVGIESAVEQLSEQLEAVFSIAKLEAGQMAYAPQRVTLDSLFVQAINKHLDDAHERQLHLRHVSTGRTVFTDEGLLLRAIDRMVAHALSITTEGGVLLGCRQRGDIVLIEVWDSSRGGIAPELLPHVFVAGSNYGQNLKDRGLGLVLARRIASKLGGRLTLESRAGRGCVLRLALPATD